MDEIISIIGQACLQHRDSGEASTTREARVILKALADNDYRVVRRIKQDVPDAPILGGELKIYEIRTQGEKDWICHYSVIGALKKYQDITDINLHDFDSDDEIVEVPREKWSQYHVTDDEEQTTQTFEEYMKDQAHPDIIASTVY